ncbi:hypothetical protein [Marinobacter sp. NSM]|uniref:hypothetical protein n=1 Tax=Marinobacter sp. NSM TaxID=3458004 RepID=UPI004035EBCD
MKTKKRHLPLGLLMAAGLALTALAQADDAVVKVNPLGSHDGEFCSRDRALIFEDPNGTRILYDAGRTVAGPDDPRLGNIDVILVSHMHGDHVGDQRIDKTNQGSCGNPETSVSSLPQSNTVDIALKKKSTIVTGSEMPAFFAAKLNEVATENGKVVAGTRTARFTELVSAAVHVPLSGRTMAFNGAAGCISGCN